MNPHDFIGMIGPAAQASAKVTGIPAHLLPIPTGKSIKLFFGVMCTTTHSNDAIKITCLHPLDSQSVPR